MNAHRLAHRNRLVLWLAVAAVLLRAMIPDGFMPERSHGAAGLTLAICYAGPLAALRDAPLLRQATSRAAAQDPRQHPAPHDGGHADCPFAGAAAPALPAGAVPGLDALAARSAPRSAYAASALLAAARLRPPSRAPPRYS